MAHKKNNHFVPKSYLKRFSSNSDRQICLFNIKSSRVIQTAPIKTQCSRDYFYSRDPTFEDAFAAIEGAHSKLLDGILSAQAVPEMHTEARALLSQGVMFQAGRTASAAARDDHLANQLGKAVLRHQFERSERIDLLDYLAHVEISSPEGVLGSVVHHFLMAPLIDDLECSVLINCTHEDFVTSDHPVVLCNGLPGARAEHLVGYASRGLIILYPISPRALILLSDPHVYRTDANEDRAVRLEDARDVVEMNIMQFSMAEENVYFATPERVRRTLATFQERKEEARPPLPCIEETLVSYRGRRGVLLAMQNRARRLHIPRVVRVRFNAKKGKYEVGNENVRDPLRVEMVKSVADQVRKEREEAERARKVATSDEDL